MDWRWVSGRPLASDDPYSSYFAELTLSSKQPEEAQTESWNRAVKGVVGLDLATL